MGPFTGGQLTLIILGITLAIAFPIGAWAVTGSNVFVTDATSGNTAKVTASGQLITKAVVSGSVTGSEAAPSELLTIEAGSTGSSFACGFYTPPTGKALVITRIDLSPYNATPSSTQQIEYDAVDVCGAGATTNSFASDVFDGETPYTVDLGAGIALAHGHRLSVTGTGDPNGGVLGYIHGYLIPASACTSGCL